MIDIAKGIGIFLIVLGHDSFFQQRFGGPSELLRAFRIPFFFFMSGATFSLSQRYLGTIARERADAWLKPFVVTVLLMGIFKFIDGTGSVESTVLGLVFGTGYTLSPIAIWFLPHLWLLYMCCAMLLRHGARLVDSWPKRVVFLLAMISVGYLVLDIFDSPSENKFCSRVATFDWQLFDCGLPLSADFVLLTATYFLLGHFLSSRVKQFKASMVWFGLASVALLGSHFAFHMSIDFNERRYDHLVVCTIQALLGIYVMLSISSLLSHSRQITALLTYLGRGSLFILLFHLQVLALWSTFAGPLIGQPMVVAATGIVVAIALPLGLWELAKRNKFAAALFLPLKKPAPAKLSNA